MVISIIRKPSAKGATLSTWYVDGAPACVGCEDVVRPGGEYVYGQTAIPAGTYNIIVNRSQRFSAKANRDVFLPLLTDIPGQVKLFGGRPVGTCGIRIHGGNRPQDTEGCLLPGSRVGADGASVDASQVAFQPLFAKIQAALKRGEKVTLTIK